MSIAMTVYGIRRYEWMRGVWRRARIGADPSADQPPEHDQHKLRALTDPHLWFAYWIGVYLVLGKTSVVSDVYTGGVIDQALSSWLAERIRDAGLGVG
jgi:hypothetical protein